MYRAEVTEKDNAYMYKFRTKACTKKRCRYPARCFDAHSPAMRRRVPVQDEQGQFNYIPEHCAQWQKTKKCRNGDSCQRSHGWLEVIFHPLLYKTKMCRSYYKNGACREYGVYCAKAHNPSEIRNLVKIYGEDWKRHYDLSKKEKDSDFMSIVKSGRKCFTSRKTLAAIPSKMELDEHDLTDCLLDNPNGMTNLYADQNQGLDVAYTSPKASNLNTFDSLENHSVIFGSPPLFGSYDSICYRMADLFLDRRDISYVDLYDKTPETSEGHSEFNMNSNRPAVHVSSDYTCSQPSSPSPHRSSASFTSNTKFSTPSLDHSEIFDVSGSDDSCRMDAKAIECGAGNQLEWGNDNNPQSLFARPNYEANQKE